MILGGRDTYTEQNLSGPAHEIHVLVLIPLVGSEGSDEPTQSRQCLSCSHTQRVETD